jgi:uncharacterized membrane protein
MKESLPSRTEQEKGGEMLSTSRVEALSDGVFAIAITLLILTIAQPSDYHHLGRQLVDRWPSLAAYVVSFFVIGIMWVNHHAIMNHLAHVDRRWFYRNLILLMTIVFIPFPTEVFGQALQQQQGQTTAAVFYSLAMVVNALAWSAVWLDASRRRRLLKPSFPESQRRSATVSFVAGTGIYAISVVVALINPYVCLAFHAAIALYFAGDPIGRRVERERAHGTG